MSRLKRVLKYNNKRYTMQRMGTRKTTRRRGLLPKFRSTALYSESTHSQHKVNSCVDLSQAGFTLIEALLSLFVVGVVITVAFDLTNATGQINRRTRIYSEANSLAFGKVQDYANTSFDSIPVGSINNNFLVEDFSNEVSTRSGGLVGNPDGKVFTTYFPGSRSLIEIRVVLDFDYGADRRTVEYANFIQIGGIGR